MKNTCMIRAWSSDDKCKSGLRFERRVTKEVPDASTHPCLCTRRAVRNIRNAYVPMHAMGVDVL
jgi:hypothetical protein